MVDWNDSHRMGWRGQCTQVTRQMQLLAESKSWDPEHIPEISSLVVLNEKTICTYWG